MSFLSYESKGLSGLANLGNSCYLNSCMQILSHTYELNIFLSNENSKYKHLLKKIPESVVLLEWDKLREMLWTNNCTIAPHGFIVEILGNKSYDLDNYYVKFETNVGSGFGPGIWRETVAPGIVFEFDETTMPHVLIYNATTDTFIFEIGVKNRI